MRKKEWLILAGALLLASLSVLIGSPAKKQGGFISTARVSAESASITPASGSAVSVTPAASPSVSPAVTSGGAVSGTPTPTTKPTATPIPLTGIPSGSPTPTAAGPSANAVLTGIDAFYLGDSVEIGDDIDKKKLKVNALYDDGSYQELTGGYEVPDTKVTVLGTNKFLVVYRGHTAVFYVQGMKLDSIMAECMKFGYGLYNGLSTRDLTVMAIYSDGSSRQLTKEQYTYEPVIFSTSGVQNVTVKYKGKTAQFTVMVNQEKAIKSLSVSYEDPEITIGEEINREKLVVTAVYNDETFSTERIETYSTDVTKFEKVGENTLNVRYRGLSASCTFNVIARTITGLSAKYIGEDIEVGDEVQRKDLEVKVTYNQTFEAVTDDYGIYDTVIRYIGENQIKIFIGDRSTNVIVNGIEPLPIDFSYVSEFPVRSGEYSFIISTAIPKRLPQDAVAGTIFKKTKLTKAYRKLKTKTGWYCGIDFEFKDDNNEVYLPVAVRIQVPAGMEPEYTELYYTPNRKSIVGKMNKKIVDENTFEVLVFKTGIYMIVYDPESYKEEPEEPETED